MQYGHFDNDALEYVIDRPDTPAPWINYLGQRDWCTVIDGNAGGYSFYKSSEHGRVTRFRPNAANRPGHYLYVRDDDTADFWTASWQPVGGNLGEHKYRTRHGLGYSVFECEREGIGVSQRVFVPVDTDAEVWDVTVTNLSEETRNISLFGYVEFSFHSVQIDNENFQMSLYASGADYADGIVEYDFYYEPWTYHYFTSTLVPDSFDTLRDSFLGAYRSESNPLAVEQGACSGSQATTQNHCGALQNKLQLAPGESVRLAYILGYGRRSAGVEMRSRFTKPEAVDSAIEELAGYWAAKRAKLQVETPSEDMNTLLNTWTLLQAETCVVWSRFASFVEVGGRTGLGYRDTAQDVMSVAHTNPGKVKQRLLELLHGQMSVGYGLHLFDPLLWEERTEIPGGVKLPTVVPTKSTDMVHGLADACSDDHLWLVPSVLEYVVETGELSFLDEIVPFADSELTAAEREGVLGDLAGRFSAKPATVYEHLRRAVEFTAHEVGDNGVAKGLRADWNDCLNLGGGETALVSFLNAWAAGALKEAAVALGRTEDAKRMDEIIASVEKVANAELWDGDWYLRGFTREGAKIGSASNEEGKLFLEHMPWAVISGVAPYDRGISSMDAVGEKLASEWGTHLCWPSYTKVDDSIGYVTRVYPGVKENGSIFSHPNAWPIIAEAMLGRGDRAWRFYETMAPARQNDMIETRGAEPYVYAQFVYGRDHEWFGKAQNPWLTGTAGWMYTAATKYLLGVRPTLGGLIVDPCIPADWPGFQIRRQWRGATYEISVSNPNGKMAGLSSAMVDGQPVELSQVGSRQALKLPLPEEGKSYRVEAVL